MAIGRCVLHRGTGCGASRLGSGGRGGSAVDVLTTDRWVSSCSPVTVNLVPGALTVVGSAPADAEEPSAARRQSDEQSPPTHREPAHYHAPSLRQAAGLAVLLLGAVGSLYMTLSAASIVPRGLTMVGAGSGRPLLGACAACSGVLFALAARNALLRKPVVSCDDRALRLTRTPRARDLAWEDIAHISDLHIHELGFDNRLFSMVIAPGQGKQIRLMLAHRYVEGDAWDLYKAVVTRWYATQPRCPQVVPPGTTSPVITTSGAHH